MESFFKTLEVERVYQLRYQDRATTRVDIVHLEAYYNSTRTHSAIA